MSIKYSPSVNIIRDYDRNLAYIPTPNGVRITDLITKGFVNGLRSFTLIGSYGTGKSSFLWALAQTILNKKRFFETELGEDADVEVLNMVGEFRPVSHYFADFFGVDKSEMADFTSHIFSEIFNHYRGLGSNKRLLVILVDEFGKFLEHAVRYEPEKELYFLQQLAEFVNNSDHNIILITALHQNFDAYSTVLSEAQRFEWTKVKGRFHEIPFNEQVELLLELAGKRLSQSNEWGKTPEFLPEIAQAIAITKSFKLSLEKAPVLARSLFPLDLCAASILTLALQKYGQNERSLFTFLENSDFTSLRSYDRRENPFFNVANVFDYLVFNLHGELNSVGNFDLAKWSVINEAIERIENEIVDNVVDCLKLLKTIGLLNIFATAGSNLDTDFLIYYSYQCLGIEKPEQILKTLEDRKIILYRNYANRFVPFEGTDIDIQHELHVAADRIGELTDLSTLLNQYFRFQPVFAKQYYFRNGTPRLFEFVISDFPKANLFPKGETDGFINLIFSDRLTLEDIQLASRSEEAVLFGFYRNSKAIRDLLYEIERTKKALEKVPTEDRVARRELMNIQAHQETLLNHYILHNLYTEKGEVSWFFNGELMHVSSKREFNVLLTQICLKIYPNTPIFKNELVNRTKLSAQIQTAKRAFLKNLCQHWDKPDLGFPKDKFPPEKTIFITLVKENDLAFDSNAPEKHLSVSFNNSFRPLWEASEQFLESARTNRRRVSDLSNLLSKQPFKLKQGLLDFWLPTFLFIKRDDFALFAKNGGYIPTLNEDTFDLLIRNPEDFEIKTFDVEGIRLEIFNSYRQFLNQIERTKVNNLVFVETIRPFLTFYRKLPDYAKNTKRLTKDGIAIREIIKSATDPEKTFFEDFPAALNTNLQGLQKSSEALEAYITRLQEAIREVRACYMELMNRFEIFLLTEVLAETLPFEKYKSQLYERFRDIKPHLLLLHQKTFVIRLASELDEREAWLNSLAQAVVGRSLKEFRDEDEALLYDRFKSIILELDSLRPIAQALTNMEKEEVFGLEITTFEQIEKKIVRFPKQKKAEIQRLEEMLKTHLSSDKTLNIAALANVLKYLLKKNNTNNE